MRLITTLEDRPGFLHAMPMFDLFVLVMMVLYMGPRLLNQGGVEVELARSQFQLQRFEDTVVVTLGPGISGSRLYWGREPMTLPQLESRLEEMKEAEEGQAGRPVVLLKADRGVRVAEEREVSELIMQAGYRVALVGQLDEPAEPGTR